MIVWILLLFFFFWSAFQRLSPLAWVCVWPARVGVSVTETLHCLATLNKVWGEAHLGYVAVYVAVRRPLVYPMPRAKDLGAKHC